MAVTAPRANDTGHDEHVKHGTAGRGAFAHKVFARWSSVFLVR